MEFIPRTHLIDQVRRTIQRFPVTLISGPRQCGKTTLAKEICTIEGGTYFDLEDPTTPLQPEQSSLILKELQGLIVIDEFHRQPEIFSLLRVLADRRPLPARFLVLGSAAPDLVKGISESLAGRVAYIDMDGFSLPEVGSDQSNLLWLRGGFPPAFLADSDEHSLEWRLHFIRSFLERDIPQLGIRVPAVTLRRFWTMLAHLHGRVWNAAELARSMGTKEDTARHYLDILTGAFMLRQLLPWYENIGKRLVKAPKVYFRDTGLLHALLDIKDRWQLLSHPKLGFSWESFGIEQVLRSTGMERTAFFYKTYAGAELDLLLVKGDKRYGFEFKFSDSLRTTRSMQIVLQDLQLEKLWVIHPGTETYPLRDKIQAVPIFRLDAVLTKAGLRAT
jgi:hypothetical protein